MYHIMFGRQCFMNYSVPCIIEKQKDKGEITLVHNEFPYNVDTINNADRSLVSDFELVHFSKRR